MTSDLVRVLLVDDEPPARERLAELLRSEPDLEIVGEAENGVSAVRCILELSPDLVFLDIQMPDLDGFGVLEALSEDRQPEVVFVTAYDEHALAAFDAAAVDYLLKPFSDERFAQALTRARAALAGGDPWRFAELIRRVPPAARLPLRRIPIREGERILFVDIDSVEWIEADDVYVRLHTPARQFLLRSSLTAILARLESGRFVRVHRSAAIAVDRLCAVYPLFRGRYELELVSGARVRSSRRYREVVEGLTRCD